jgi:hypothetical protein
MNETMRPHLTAILLVKLILAAILQCIIMTFMVRFLRYVSIYCSSKSHLRSVVKYQSVYKISEEPVRKIS